jgi:hypothetical protein
MKVGGIIMKTIKAKQTFKSVSAKQVELFPVLAPKLGTKRPVVSFDLPVYEQADLADLAANNSAVLLQCLNDSLANLAKSKFASNATDWDYVPNIDTDLSLAALAASFESVSRGRVLTNESAGKLAAWLARNAASLIASIKEVDASYGQAQLTAICSVITQFTAYSVKPRAILDKVLLRMEQISEAIASNDLIAADFVEDPLLAEVFDALTKRFTKADEEEITADAL